MKSKKTIKARVFGWALLPLLALAGLGCVVVEEDTCYEGEVVCSGDYYVEECIDDTWVVVDDCDYACGGVCGYLDSGETVCVCPL